MGDCSERTCAYDGKKGAKFCYDGAHILIE